MARSADAAPTVLESLLVLYDLGGDANAGGDELLALFDKIGVDGFTADQASYFLMAGTVLRLLLRHAEADVSGMFGATQRDLAVLGQDIDEVKFQ
jgi:hypothetical protein